MKHTTLLHSFIALHCIVSCAAQTGPGSTSPDDLTATSLSDAECIDAYRNPQLGQLPQVFYRLDCLKERKAIGDPSFRPAIEDVLHNYQIQEDAMADFDAPSWCSLAGQQRLTKTEVELLSKLPCWKFFLDNSGPPALTDMLNANDLARKWSKKAVPAGGDSYLGRGHGHRDALRHALWAALIAREFGPAWSHAFTAAHEAAWVNRVREQSTIEAMDLYNNTIGVELILNAPHVTDRDLQDQLKTALEKGQLVVHNERGELAWSDDVPVADPADSSQVAHGDPVKLTLPDRIPLPDIVGIAP